MQGIQLLKKLFVLIFDKQTFPCLIFPPPSPQALKKVHNVIFVRKGRSWKSYFHCIAFHHKNSLSVKGNWWRCVILSLTCARTAFRLEIQSNMKVKVKEKLCEEGNGTSVRNCGQKSYIDGSLKWAGINLAQKLNFNQSPSTVSPLRPGPQKWMNCLSSG